MGFYGYPKFKMVLSQFQKGVIPLSQSQPPLGGLGLAVGMRDVPVSPIHHVQWGVYGVYTVLYSTGQYIMADDT